MLHDRILQEEEHDASNECQTDHNQHIVSLIQASKDKSRNEVAKDLRTHVEGPEEGKVETLIRFDGAI